MKSRTYIKSETPLFGRRQTKDAILSVVLECKYIQNNITNARK